MIEYISDCLRDPETSINDKRPALQLVPFLAIDQECLEIFTRLKLEDSLIEILNNGKSNDRVVSQVLKSLIIMHASTISFESDG